MKKIYQGLLQIADFETLSLDYTNLAELIKNDFEKGNSVFVSYYITDKKVSEAEAKKSLILKTIGGNLDELHYELYAYSEYTIEDIKEGFIVGGHDLINELKNYEGKFLTLIIEKK